MFTYFCNSYRNVSIFCDLLIRALIRFLVASITTEASLCLCSNSSGADDDVALFPALFLFWKNDNHLLIKDKLAAQPVG